MLYDKLISKIKEELEVNNTYTIAIDGGSGSGKTTLASELKSYFEDELGPGNVTVFHMDDFYLRPEQRTEARYSEPGGNVDRERFLEEVLEPLSRIRVDSDVDSDPDTCDDQSTPVKIIYRPLDCSDFTYKNITEIKPGRLRIIEGAYSHHPDLRDYYDLRVFLNIEPDLQKTRIKNRNTPEQQKLFFERWIPFENTYFDYFDIRENSDIIINIQ